MTPPAAVANADAASIETFWKRIGQMESWNKAAAEKLIFIRKVETGNEAITWSILDRVRETHLQLNQAVHCFQLAHREVDGTPFTPDARERLVALAKQSEETLAAAHQSIAIIMAWVPPAPNTRRSDGQGILGDRRG